MKRTTRDAITSARSLENELVEINADAEELEPHELSELSRASQNLKSAWTELFPAGSEFSEILDQQRAEHWWHRKLIATFPIAVFETNLEGRVLWANAAWASLVGVRVLQIVRTNVRRYFAPEDHANLEDFLEMLRAASVNGTDVKTQLRVQSEPNALANVEVTLAETRDADGSRFVATWIVQPYSEISEDTSESAKIAHVFSRLGLLPLRSRTNQELLNEVVLLSTHICPPKATVSVTVGDPMSPTAVASSSVEAQELDGIQYLSSDGPARRVWKENSDLVVQTRSGDTEFETFWARVSTDKLNSVVVAPIRIGEDVLGVLTVYQSSTHAWAFEDLQKIEFFAEAVGAVLHHVEEEQQLRTLAKQLEQAMKSREIIEQAKGILMAKYAYSAETALANLTKVSQDKNIRLRVLAQDIVDKVTRQNGEGLPSA